MKEVNKIVYVYGGAFNPPTVAHEIIVNRCYQFAKMHGAELWIMPSGDRLDKTIGTDSELRLELIDAMLRSQNIDAHIETYELYSSKLTETIDTVNYFRRTYPDVEFRWVFGADSIHTMHEWKGGKTLWQREKMLLTSRPGYELNELPPMAEVIDVATPNVSSTMVRNNIAQGLPFEQYVSTKVAKILLSKKGV